MNKRPFLALIASSALLLCTTGCQNPQLMQAANQIAGAATAPSSGESTSAVKQMLMQGVNQAITNMSSTPAEGTKIPLPAQLTQAAAVARQLGFGAQVDAFEQNINKAADKALPAASEVFQDSIKNMSITDAVGLLQGGDNAATDFFRKTTSDQLRAKFLPIVSEATGQIGILQQMKKFGPMLKTVAMLGGIQRPEIPDLDEYITSQAMDAVYAKVSEEEKKIRENPAARSTELLKKVFSFYTTPSQ